MSNYDFDFSDFNFDVAVPVPGDECHGVYAVDPVKEERIERLIELLASEKSRADAAERDRDRWHKEAQELLKLLEKFEK